MASSDGSWPHAGCDLPYHELMVRSLRSGGMNAHLVTDPMRLAASVPQAWRCSAACSRAPSSPAAATWAFRWSWPRAPRGIPSLVWEGNVVAGRATAAVGRMATRVAVSFPPTQATLSRAAPSSPARPIRSFAGVDRAAARASFGVAAG